jgi:hypothetical protein
LNQAEVRNYQAGQDRIGLAQLVQPPLLIKCSEAIPKPADDYIGHDDCDDEDTYIDDGVIAPAMEENAEDDFFV